MEVLANTSPSRQPRLVLMFGLGMIGSAIRASLVRRAFARIHSVHFDWNDAGRRGDAISAVRQFCEELAPPPEQVFIVWAAGSSNFFSSDAETREENRSFGEILELAEAVGRSLPQAEVDFHFLSSAGGLFEGQRLVTSSSRPSPQRAYGRMKQAQEHRLLDCLDARAISIYRPSSVYGPMVRRHRHGLINHLVDNAANRRTSVLDSNVMALRDYVYAGDIGEFVARRIASGGGRGSAEPVRFLVSGRCASIFEVVTQIERAMKLKVRFRLDAGFGNSANITFSDSVLSHRWRPSTLEVGIRQFLLRDRPQTRGISARQSTSH